MAQRIGDSLTGMVCITMTLTEGDQLNLHQTIVSYQISTGESMLRVNMEVEDQGWRTNGGTPTLMYPLAITTIHLHLDLHQNL